MSGGWRLDAGDYNEPYRIDFIGGFFDLPDCDRLLLWVELGFLYGRVGVGTSQVRVPDPLQQAY